MKKEKTNNSKESIGKKKEIHWGKTMHNRVIRTTHPWDKIQLSKKERLGKSFEQIQEMRKNKHNEGEV